MVYKGEITTDRYGRKIPKHAHGTINLDHKTSSSKIIMDAIIKLYERIMNKQLLVRRMNITANNVVDEFNKKNKKTYEKLDLFINYQQKVERVHKEQIEKKLQKAMIGIKKKYGKNSIIKVMNLQDGGTTIDGDKQIGCHME